MKSERNHFTGRESAVSIFAVAVVFAALLQAMIPSFSIAADSSSDDVWGMVETKPTWPQFYFGGDFQNRTTSDFSFADEYEDVFTSLEMLYVKSRASFSEKFSVTLSGLAQYNISMNQNAQVQYARFQTDLEELYIDLHLGKVDMRIGQQIVTWGITDVFSPTDTVNSVNYSAMINQELGHYKIPNLMIKTDFYPNRVHHLEAIVIPFFRPSTIDVFGGDWSIFGSHFPVSYLTESLGASDFGRQAITMLDRMYPGWEDELARDLSTEKLNALGPQPPMDNLTWEAAFRYGISYGRITWSGSYFYCFDDVPTFYFSPELKDMINTLLTGPKEPDLTKLIDQALKLDPFSLYQAEYKRAHQFGTDFSANLGPSVLRLEGTYVVDRRTYDTSLNVVELPQLTYTASIDYTFPKYVVINLEGMHVYDPYWSKDLITPQNTVYLIGYIHGSFLEDKLEAYLEILYDVSQWSSEGWSKGDIFNQGYEFSGKVSYMVVPGLTLGVGAIYFGGPKDQLFGFLNEKSFGFFDLKYRF